MITESCYVRGRDITDPCRVRGRDSRTMLGERFRRQSKGPFTLGGIPAVSGWRCILPSACCIYTRWYSEVKPLASCK